MRKFLVSLTAGLVVAGAFATSTFAAEHKVQQGESLWDIAHDYDTTVEEILNINELGTETIQPNQVLLINPVYIVKRGDNLSAIAKEHNVSVEDLMEWNDLHTSLIGIGQELMIKGGEFSEDEQQVANTISETSHVKSETVSSNITVTNNAAENTQQEGRTISVTATAYTAGCEGCSGITYTGVDLNKNPNAKVIAVDPNVIPLGSEVYVEGYGYATAADIGGAIKGNKIDLHVPTKNEAFNWGVRSVNVTILN